MNILHITPSLSVKYGGPTISILELCKAINKKGQNLTIITPYDSKFKTEILCPENINVKLLEQNFISKVWSHYSPYLSRELKKVISNYDLIHIHGIWFHPYFSATQLALKTKKPYMVSIMGMLNPFALNYKFLKKRIYGKIINIKRRLERAVVIHALTENEAYYIKKFGIHNRIEIIPNGINEEIIQEIPTINFFNKKFPELKDKFVILFLGRIHPIKGLDILVNSYSRIAKKREDIYLVIAGPNDGYKSEIEKLLKKNRISEKVLFTGLLNKSEKLAVLSRADIFILPSYSEGLSMSILEAMACKLPVIITNKCNLPEVKKFGAGIVIDPDVDQLTVAIKKLLDNPQLCDKMGENGHRLVLEKYTWNKIANKMIEVYEDIIRNH